MAEPTPALDVLIGQDLASHLVQAAGSLEELVSIPSSDLLALGRDECKRDDRALVGDTGHFGYIYDCPLLDGLSEKERRRAANKLANKVALCARTDLNGNSTADQRAATIGTREREKFINEIKRMVAPPPFREEKPIKPPKLVRKQRRAGKRYKSRSEVRRLALAVAAASVIPMDGKSDYEERPQRLIDNALRLQAREHKDKYIQRTRTPTAQVPRWLDRH